MLAAFAVDIGFGIAFVGLPAAVGEFVQYALDFLFALGMRGKFALEFGTADFLT